MKEYMLIYKGGDPEAHTQRSKEEIGEIMARWGAWMQKLQDLDKLSTGGAPLHFAGKRINAKHVITDIAAAELKELVSGYSIIKAEDIDEAIVLTKDCPIFDYPEIVVEVREVMQLG